MLKRSSAGGFYEGFSPFLTCMPLHWASWSGWEDWDVAVSLYGHILRSQKKGYHSLNFSCLLRNGPWASWRSELSRSGFFTNTAKGRHPGLSFWRQTPHQAKEWDCCGAWLSCKMEINDLGCFQCCGVSSICDYLTDVSEVLCWDFLISDPWHEVRKKKH